MLVELVVERRVVEVSAVRNALILINCLEVSVIRNPRRLSYPLVTIIRVLATNQVRPAKVLLRTPAIAPDEMSIDEI